jgi:hypothetical protein
MEDGRKVASWSGYTNNLIFYPENGDSVRVGYYEPEYLSSGIKQVERLKALRDINRVAKSMEFEEYVAVVEQAVYDATMVDVCWDWPSRKSFDAGLSPHEASIECIRAALD